MAESKLVRRDTIYNADRNIDHGDDYDTISQHYQSINELVTRSHNTFQKLYNKKEKVLI
jgi:hypothetical protein